MDLNDIAQTIKDANENIFLIYAFNGTGKTRLSTEYKETARAAATEEEIAQGKKGKQTGVYYNAYSEDLFVWDNDIEHSEENIKLKIVHSSLNDFHSFIDETKVREKLRPYSIKYDFDFHTNEKDPEAGIEYITFHLKDDNETLIKISRGEERIFVWCFFLALFDTEGWADNQNKYIFIDDPVSSLDDHNIFVTIFTLIELIEKNYEQKKIIITTHHIGFATILCDYLTKGEKSDKYKKKQKIQILESTGNDYSLVNPKNEVLLYHLRLLQILDKAISEDNIEIFHMALLRQVLENIASFMGTGQLKYVLQKIGFTDSDRIATIINALTHQKVYYPQMDAMVDDNKQIVKDVFNALMTKYNFIIHEQYDHQ